MIRALRGLVEAQSFIQERALKIRFRNIPEVKTATFKKVNVLSHQKKKNYISTNDIYKGIFFRDCSDGLIWGDLTEENYETSLNRSQTQS